MRCLAFFFLVVRSRPFDIIESDFRVSSPIVD